MWIFCGRTVIFYNIHSCTACGVIPSSITFKRCSLSCGRTPCSPHPDHPEQNRCPVLFSFYSTVPLPSHPLSYEKVITIFLCFSSSPRFLWFHNTLPAPVLLIPQQALLRRGLLVNFLFRIMGKTESDRTLYLWTPSASCINGAQCFEPRNDPISAA